MKLYRTLFSLWILPCFFTMAVGYSSGGPLSVCSSMIPGHGPSPQSSQAPFVISLNSTSYSPNDVIQVTLSGSGASFKGVFIQARKTGTTTPMGQFTLNTGENHLKTISCSGNSDVVTHKTATQSSTRIVYWTVPIGLTGEIRFIGTFVQAYPYFWINVQSSALNKKPDPTTSSSSTTTTTSTTSTATTTTTTTSTTSAATTKTSNIPTASTPTSTVISSSAGSMSTMETSSSMSSTQGGPSSSTNTLCHSLLTFQLSFLLVFVFNVIF